jgi:large subunit ribosomal protein L4
LERSNAQEKEVQATVYNLAGEEVEKIELDDTIFGITPNTTVVHQAVLRQQANARQGTHETKTRAFVRGGGRKPWRQKGTGRARQGSTRSPQWRHGGVVFGPHQRSYEQDMPRKMRRLAIRSVLSSKTSEGRIVVVDSFEELEPRTKAMADLMKKLNIGESSALIMTADWEANLELAASNLPKVNTMSAHLLSVVDMLKHNYLVMPRASLEVIDDILGYSGGRVKKPLTGFKGTTSIEILTPKRKKTAKVEVAEEAPTETESKAEVVAEEEAKEESKARATSRSKSKVKTAKPSAVSISNVQYSGEEYVEITSKGRSEVDLGGWVLRDKNDTGQSFTFPEGAKLAKGDSLQVYTKPGNDYSFESKKPIWNDKGDQVELLDASGEVVDTYSYGSYATETEEGEE